MSPLRLSLGLHVTRLHCIHGVIKKGESLAYACICIFMHSYIYIRIFARIHPFCASRFPETKKNQRIVDYGERRINYQERTWSHKEEKGRLSSCRMSMPCHNKIINTIKVVI